MNRESPGASPVEGKSSVACQRCRDHKLKCNREILSCSRCLKQKVACKYPLPPDRRRAAQKTSQAKAAALELSSTSIKHLSIDSSGSSVPSKSGKRPRFGDSIKESGRDYVPDASSTNNFVETNLGDLPSTEVGLLLLEVYFKRVYNATLLFHKTVTFEKYRSNSLPGYLLRAIFAHAATFLEEVDSPYSQYIKILPMQTLFEKSWLYARSASQEVLSYADEPTLVRIQTLQVLQLYYFSRGETQRAIVHASLAYRLSQLLEYDRLHKDVASLSTAGSLQVQFDHEMKRRCFWAIWCSFSIGSQRLDSLTKCERASILPLPAIFEKGGSVQGVELRLGQSMDQHWNRSLLSKNGKVGSSSCSLMAELVRLLGIWNRVQAFISDSSSHSNSQRAIKFNELIQLFEPIERTLHLSVTNICSLAEFYNENPELVTCVFSVYHLSRLLLHASMVPLLSGCSVGTPAERDSAQENDGAALQQAVSFVKLLQQVIANDLDITRLWPFIGYGAFVAGSVFVAHNSTMQSSRSIGLSVQGIGRDAEEIKIIQTVLEVLSIYWKPLRQLAIKFRAAINVDVGQSSDLDLITSSIYPFDVRPSSHSLEEHALTQTRAPRTSHPNLDLPSQQVHEPYSSDVSEAERQENCVESFQMLPFSEQQLSSESGYQSGLEENMMTADCSSGLLGTDLWNEWDYQTLQVAADYCDSSAFLTY